MSPPHGDDMTGHVLIYLLTIFLFLQFLVGIVMLFFINGTLRRRMGAVLRGWHTHQLATPQLREAGAAETGN